MQCLDLPDAREDLAAGKTQKPRSPMKGGEV
jgi:hypothetical protein